MEKEIWIPRLDSMNQRQDLDKIPDTYSPLLVNISVDKPGSWSTRKGLDLLATTQVGVGVQGLVNYHKLDGTDVTRAIRSTDLDTYASDAYTQIDGGQFTAASKISSINFNNLVYHSSNSDFICKESGGACADVGSGSDRLKANNLCVAQNTLFASNIAYANGGAQNWQNRCYYSAFDSGNNVPSDQFWNTSEGSLANSTRWFTLPGIIEGSVAFGSAPGLSYHFTSSECYSFDMGLINNQIGPQSKFSEGLANKRAVTVCKSWMVFMNKKGSIFAWGGAGTPDQISFEIEDDSKGEAIINSISPSQIASVAAGSLGNKVFFSLGDITYYNVNLTNVVLVGLLLPGEYGVTALWSLYTFPVKPVIFSNAVFNNREVLLFGADGVDDVYQIETGTSDNGTAINAYARTKYQVPSSHLRSNDFRKLLIKYRPQASSGTNLRVKYAVDGSIDYQTLSDPDATNPVTRYGVVDMYHASATTKLDDIKEVEMPPEASGRSLTIEVGNNQLDEKFEVTGIGFKADVKDLDITPK